MRRGKSRRAELNGLLHWSKQCLKKKSTRGKGVDGGNSTVPALGEGDTFGEKCKSGAREGKREGHGPVRRWGGFLKCLWIYVEKMGTCYMPNLNN